MVSPPKRMHPSRNAQWGIVILHHIAMLPYGGVSKPCTPGEHQNSWDLWMFIPLKMVLRGIDPYPYLPGGAKMCQGLGEFPCREPSAAESARPPAGA